jgi:hypothetical protein
MLAARAMACWSKKSIDGKGFASARLTSLAWADARRAIESKKTRVNETVFIYKLE